MENNIRQLLEERGWRQRDLAKIIDKSETHVNLIINGKHQPSLELAYRIAGAFGVSIERVFPRREQVA